MNERFDLPVIYEGEQFHFRAQLLQWGYTYKFEVEIAGEIIFFEPDKESSYRAVMSPAKIKDLQIEPQLLQEIANALASL